MSGPLDEGQLFEAVLESPDSFIGVLGPDGRLRRANQRALEFVVVTPEEVEGAPFWETPWWNHSTALQEEVQSWVDRAGAVEYVRYEAPHYAPDGTRVEVDGILRPVTDETDTVRSIIAEGRDVTRQREHERQVVEQRRRLTQLNRINETLRTAHEHIVRADDRDELEQSVCDCLTETGVYEAAWTGRYDQHDEAITATTWNGIDDEHFDSVDITADESPTGFGPVGRAVRSRSVHAVQNIATAEQMTPWREQLLSMGVESIAAVPVLHDGTVYGVIGVWAHRPAVFNDRERDALSELGRSVGDALATLELQSKLEEKNDRLGQFATLVSHDLRNPLSVATSRLELAQQECDTAHLDEAARAIDRMDALIDDVLTLARSGADVDETDPVSLPDLARECWKTVSTDQASLVVDTEVTIQADRSRLRQLFENLVRNAVEHGGADVTVRVGRIGDGFYVADDGAGIPSDDRDRLFESGYSTSDNGTGLGLAIVRDIATAHGWTVEATDDDAGGARFEITGVEVVG